jgi:two-component system, NtrC family, response regulator GlrR
MAGEGKDDDGPLGGKGGDARTTTLPFGGAKLAFGPGTVRRFRLTVVEGGPKPGLTVESSGDRCSIGFHPSNDMNIEDATVSRFHCEIRMDGAGARVRDLNSRNGTVLDGVLVVDAFLRSGSILNLGRVTVRFDFVNESNRLPLSDKTEFGGMVGASVPMRTAFALMERAATTDLTVLIEGETGTGKGRAAEAIHRASPRRDKPFLVVDCGAIPANLLESELFGHEKGSFTGASGRRIGAFEEASSGTIFLDEIGELPQDLQPKLLRVLESKEIRRVGSNAHLKVDVRVIAATNRDLRSEVNNARFRSDLYFRLAVVRIPLPSLRQRPEDIPVMVEQILKGSGASGPESAALRTPDFFATLQRSAWPGNVRELRNYIERCLVFQEALPAPDAAPADHGGVSVDARLPYQEARRRALDDFERCYLDALLRLHQGKVSQAATAADVDRVYLYKLLRRHNIKP